MSESPPLVNLIHARAVVARAGESDCLKWWDSEALSEPGSFVLGRLFRRTASRVGVSMACAAAEARHRDACPKGSIGLFDLGSNLEEELQEEGRQVKLPAMTPIRSGTELMSRLQSVGVGDIAQGAPGSSVGPGPVQVGQVSEKEARELPRVLSRLPQLLAAYCRGETGNPVFPYLEVA